MQNVLAVFGVKKTIGATLSIFTSAITDFREIANVAGAEAQEATKQIDVLTKVKDVRLQEEQTASNYAEGIANFLNSMQAGVSEKK